MPSCGDARIAMLEVRSTTGEGLCGIDRGVGLAEHTGYTPLGLRYYAGAPRWWVLHPDHRRWARGNRSVSGGLVAFR